MPASTYKPQYDGPIAGWTVNHIQANYWRVKRVREREDLFQDAQEVFLRCAQRYPDMDTPQHFMSLYQRSWCNHMHDLSHDATSARAEVSMTARSTDEGEASTFERESIGDLDNDGYLAIKLRQAPAEVKMVLSLFLNAPQEILDAALGSWKGKDRRCSAGGSKKICRLLGLPEDLDVMQQVSDYFSERS